MVKAEGFTCGDKPQPIKQGKTTEEDAAMKLLIAGLATGLLFAGVPARADNERGDGWRGNHRNQQFQHRDNRWEHHDRHLERHREHRHPRHWERRYERYDRHYYHPAPRLRHRDYYYRNYSYGYPAPQAYIDAPSVYFSWSVR